MSLVKPKAMHFYMTTEEKDLLEKMSKKNNKSQAEMLRLLIRTQDDRS